MYRVFKFLAGVYMGKPFITREGYDQLHKELDYLWEVKRPEITQKVSWAASLGDRSENADYHYNKRLLGQIDRRIRYLRHCMNDLQVIEYNKQQEGRVFFGAYVEIESDDDSSKLQIRIVGSDEIFGRSNCISVDAPMARALLGKSVDDDAEVVTPHGKRLWYVNKITYQKPEWFEEQPIVENSLASDDNEEVVVEEMSEEEQKKIEQEYLKTLVQENE
ncbi:MAG: transcription elongation factor GreB [Succinatimonas sp.]|nr:transcription elongation factor GreB [Succinatimonas sp.]MDD6377629.1 transcription elongation factor GreB [Succinatimonas sp.]